MAYSPRLRAAVGAVRAALEAAGLGLQSPRFAEHGEHKPDADAPLVLVACSGGRDSMALAAVAGTVCASLGVRCGAIIVDHGLQTGSADVAEEAAGRCRSFGLGPVEVRRVEVADAAGEGLEAAAREARYAALIEAAHNLDAAAVLLAHTLDDQAETVLIGLLRSGGVDALAGMPARVERGGVPFLRPLLSLTRADTTGICDDLGLEYWDDPTNGPDIAPVSSEANGSVPLPRDYPLRSRIRHDLLPYINAFSGADVTQRLADGARLARDDKDYLDQAAARVARTVVRPGAADSEILSLDAKALAGEHPAIRRRVIAHALSSAGIAANARQVEAIDRLIVDWHGQGPVDLPSGHSANRKKHVIRVCQDGAHANR